jgi:hypothetical protein
MTNKAVNSSIPFKVEVSYFAKNGDGVFEVVGSPEVYPAGTNEYMSGVVQSPLNGEDMYMGDFYKNTGQAKILSSWRNGKVFACGLKESLFVSFWLGSREIEGVYIKRYQSNGTFNVGVYGWNGVFSNGSGENHKMIVSNIGGYGINGLLDAGMDDLLLGDDVFIDKETLRYEVKFVADVASAELYYGPIGVPNDGILKDIVGMIDLTEKIEVLVDSCDADIFKRIHWLNRFGGMDSRSFKMFARRVSKTKSQRSRKALNWGGANVSPNDRSQRSVKRGNIENEISFEIEEIVDNEVAVWLEQLMESPCVYMEDIDDFIAVGIEDGEIVPSDTDEGLRVIKLKFIIDNTNLKIQ